MIQIVLAALAGLTFSAAGPVEAPPTLGERLQAGARIQVINAHPDDETLVGAILVEACVINGNACRFSVLTRGEGGDCSLRRGCPPDLGTFRTNEMIAVAGRYGAEVSFGPFTNFPHYTTGGQAWINHIAASWRAEGDPVRWIRQEINRFRPDIVISVDPGHGFYGHDEHILAGALVEEALGLRRLTYGAASTAEAPLTHKPDVLYQVLNKYRLFKPIVGNDPLPASETWDARRRCQGRKCIEIANEIAWLHASQKWSGILVFDIVHRFVKTIYLHRQLVP